MLKPRLSIRTLLLVLTILSALIGIAVHRVGVQRRAVSAIQDMHGTAFSESQLMDNSFSSNLRNSVTEIGLPSPEAGLKIQSSIKQLPSLERIVITDENDQSKIARLRKEFPEIEIQHRFFLGYGADTMKFWKTAR